MDLVNECQEGHAECGYLTTSAQLHNNVICTRYSDVIRA